jgi:hypothetical protein
LIRLVVGVGIVVVAHKPRNHDRQPRNHPPFNLTPTHDPIFQPAALRLSSTSHGMQPATSIQFQPGSLANAGCMHIGVLQRK